MDTEEWSLLRNTHQIKKCHKNAVRNPMRIF